MTVLETLAEAIVERGAGGGVAAAEVIARSGVSAQAFHEEFPDREACLLAALDVRRRACPQARAERLRAESRSLDAVKARLVAFPAHFLEQEQALGRLLVVYSLSGGEAVVRRRLELLAVLAEAVDRGWPGGARGTQQPPTVSAGACFCGGVFFFFFP